MNVSLTWSKIHYSQIIGKTQIYTPKFLVYPKRLVTFAGTMEEKQVQLNFRSVPLSWQLCFLSECPKKDECLRQMVAKHLPKSRQFGPAVYPTMEIGENGCRLFTACRPKQMAWGFETLFSDVKSKHEQGLRQAMKSYLGGHGTYYRCNSGKKLLTPEQQEWIINLFRQNGYSENLVFDHYVTAYDFDH